MRDTSFSYAFLALPSARRNAIVAVWDFCRAVDDAVDEAGEGEGGGLSSEARAAVAAELAMWRAEVARVFDGGNPLTPQGRRLRPVAAEFALTRPPFDDLVDGVEMDLDRARYDTFEALSEYCQRVASAVGLMCIEIFGCRGAREYAVNLGLALQLTNILRDIRGDLARGRVYLPQEDLRRFSVKEDDLSSGRLTPHVRQLLAFECGRAHEYFGKARRALPPEDRRKLIAAEIMGAIYQGLLRRIERRNYDVFSEKVLLPRVHRAWLAARTWARVRTSMPL